MNSQLIQLNLLIAWLWIGLGFVSGLMLGLKFHREDWLGGYASFKRRLYRLAHISFFGLGAVNWMFHLTASGLSQNSAALAVAAGAFMAGAVTMPLSCVLMAHWPGLRLLFAVPVVSLLIGGSLTLWELTYTMLNAANWNLAPGVAAYRH